MFLKNREEAGQLLLQKLKNYRNQNPLVLGIPRGAMPMAKIIAEGLHGELNAVLVHKIPFPHAREVAIGSVGLSGKIFRLPRIEFYEISDSYIEREAEKQLAVLRKRKEMFRLPDLNCQGRIVIIVDDGIATGATAIGAIQEIRSQNPKKLILAAGVVARSTATTIRSMVDEFIVLEEPDGFFAVSQYFADFSEVTDEDVVEILRDKKYYERSI